MDFNFIELMILIGITTICGLLLRIIHLMEENKSKEIKEQGKKREKQFVISTGIFVFIVLFLVKCTE